MTDLISHKNVFVALAAAQGEMAPVVKGAINPHFSSKYADLADVVSAAAPALSRHGLMFYHYLLREERATYMITAIVHGESDTRIECEVPLIVGKQDMQGFKSATTYAKRIGLESVTGLAPEDDDGNAAAKNAPKNKDRPLFDPQDPGPQPEPRTPSESASEGLRDAWLDGIKDSLPADYTPRQMYEGVAAALIDAFAKKKSAAGVTAQWDKREQLIDEIEVAHKDLYANILDAYSANMRRFEPEAEEYLRAG